MNEIEILEIDIGDLHESLEPIAEKEARTEFWDGLTEEQRAKLTSS